VAGGALKESNKGQAASFVACAIAAHADAVRRCLKGGSSAPALHVRPGMLWCCCALPGASLYFTACNGLTLLACVGMALLHSVT